MVLSGYGSRFFYVHFPLENGIKVSRCCTCCCLCLLFLEWLLVSCGKKKTHTRYFVSGVSKLFFISKDLIIIIYRSNPGLVRLIHVCVALSLSPQGPTHRATRYPCHVYEGNSPGSTCKLHTGRVFL